MTTAEVDEHDFDLLDDVSPDSIMDHDFDFCLGVNMIDDNTTYTPRFHWASTDDSNNAGGNHGIFESDADPELQKLLMELENESSPAMIPIVPSTILDEVKSLDLLISDKGGKTSNLDDSSAQAKLVTDKRKGIRKEGLKNFHQKNNIPDETCSSFCTCDPQLSQSCPFLAKQARRRRMEVLLNRRRSRNGASSTLLANQERIAEEHKKQTLEALASPPPVHQMEDVISIAHQLVLSNNAVNIPRNVSVDELSSSVIEANLRPPSPVFSSSLVQPKKTQHASVSIAIPDTTTSSSSLRQGSQRSSSVPPSSSGRRKSNTNSSKQRGRSAKRSSSSATQSSVTDTPLPEGDDPESRRQRRLIRNRMSAQLHRERKREAMDTLQRLINERDAHIRTLEEQLQSTRNKEKGLEKALGIIQRHFGKTVIEGILLNNSPQATPDSPPHLVNSSDMSSCDEDDTSCLASSPVPSHSSTDENKESIPKVDAGKCPIPQLSDATTKQQAQQLRVVSKKRKISTWNSALMAPLAFCAFIACLAVVPFESDINLSLPLETINMVSKPNGNSYKHASTTSDNTRRRLLSVKSSTTGESLIDQILSSSGQGNDNLESSTTSEDWIFSPLEHYPASWKVKSDSSELKYPTPWTYQESELLFDLRSKPNASLSMEGNMKKEHTIPIGNLSSSSKAKLQLRGSRVRKEKTEKVTSSNSSAFAERQRVMQKKLDNEERVQNNYTTVSTLSSLETPFSPRVNAVSNNSNHEDDNSNHDPSLTSATGKGSNFLFCPNSHAKLSSYFLGLTKDDTSRRSNIDRSDDISSTKNQFKQSSIEDGTDRTPIVQITQHKLSTSEHAKPIEAKQQNVSHHGPSSTALVPATQPEYPDIKNSDSYLSILLPASAISGGVTHSSKSEPWIELGCQVLSAKILHGVTFMEGEYSS